MSLPIFFLIFTDAMRVTPSLPQRGRQHAGSIPLTPFLSGFSINLLVIIALLWDARAAGAEAHCAEAQKSDWLFLFRISTERENHKKILGKVPIQPLNFFYSYDDIFEKFLELKLK